MGLVYILLVLFCCCFFFLYTDLDGREISPRCPGVNTLRRWKMLRWKMKMEKIYPWLLLLFVRTKFSMNYWNFVVAITQCVEIQLGHFRFSYFFVPMYYLTSLWYGFVWKLFIQVMFILFWAASAYFVTLAQLWYVFPWLPWTFSEFTAVVPMVLCCSCSMEEVTLLSHGQCSLWAQ